mmetsp:Transcript_28275/g.90071  ORF Transcript_28275/g.90071 Transcript_28275/m.90071 type:complete len:241 (+) Transcript_28275:78-800(+)
MGRQHVSVRHDTCGRRPAIDRPPARPPGPAPPRPAAEGGGWPNPLAGNCAGRGPFFRTPAWGGDATQTDSRRERAKTQGDSGRLEEARAAAAPTRARAAVRRGARHGHHRRAPPPPPQRCSQEGESYASKEPAAAPRGQLGRVRPQTHRQRPDVSRAVADRSDSARRPQDRRSSRARGPARRGGKRRRSTALDRSLIGRTRRGDPRTGVPHGHEAPRGAAGSSLFCPSPRALRAASSSHS